MKDIQEDSGANIMITNLIIKRKVFRDRRLESLRKTQRSKVGFGDELKDIMQQDNEFYFIPSNVDCFVKCIVKVLEMEGYNIPEEEVQEVYRMFCVEYNVIKYFPQCKIGYFLKILHETFSIDIDVCRYIKSKGTAKSYITKEKCKK